MLLSLSWKRISLNKELLRPSKVRPTRWTILFLWKYFSGVPFSVPPEIISPGQKGRHFADYFFRCIFVNEFIIPPLQRNWKGVYCFHLVRLSVCPSVDRIVSALYLQQYSLDPFDICTSYLENFRMCVASYACFKIKKIEILANSLIF